MKPSIFLNDMLTKGAILGGVMLLSSLAENAMMAYGDGAKWLTIMGIEVLLSAAIFIFLAFRFTRNYANLVLAERKDMPYFTFGNGFSYVVTISMLAGVITALGSYMFRHYIIGYENYISAYIKLIQDALSQTEIPASMVGTYEQMFKAIESQQEPSLITSIFSSVWSYLVSGTIVGLFIAGATKRQPNLFNNKEE